MVVDGTALASQGAPPHRSPQTPTLRAQRACVRYRGSMRLGIVSDIHCNHEALSIALERMGAIDELLCAGDAVYQFRFSNEVIQILRERCARYVLGNHEAVL